MSYCHVSTAHNVHCFFLLFDLIFLFLVSESWQPCVIFVFPFIASEVVAKHNTASGALTTCLIFRLIDQLTVDHHSLLALLGQDINRLG